MEPVDHRRERAPAEEVKGRFVQVRKYGPHHSGQDGRSPAHRQRGDPHHGAEPYQTVHSGRTEEPLRAARGRRVATPVGHGVECEVRRTPMANASTGESVSANPTSAPESTWLVTNTGPSFHSDHGEESFDRVRWRLLAYSPHPGMPIRRAGIITSGSEGDGSGTWSSGNGPTEDLRYVPSMRLERDDRAGAGPEGRQLAFPGIGLRLCEECLTDLRSAGVAPTDRRPAELVRLHPVAKRHVA